MKRNSLVIGLVVAIVGALLFAFNASASILTTADPVPVPTCTKPTSDANVRTNAQKGYDYAKCLAERAEALGQNQHAPAPTVTETVTVTPSPTTPPPTDPTSPPPTDPTTPPPSGTVLKGWELKPSGAGANVGLAAHGLTCAGLPTYSGPSEIPAGTTISQKRFLDRIDVSAGGITIEKSCFQGDNPASASDGLVEGYYPQGDTTIKDSEFDGSRLSPENRDSACAFTGGANLLRNYVHDVGSGLCMVSSSNVREENKAGVNVIPKDLRIVNNYVHQHSSCCGAHHEAATVRDFIKDEGNTRTMKWVGNWLDITGAEFVSGGMFLQATFEPIHNLWLEDNVFAGEGYNLVIDPSVGNLHVTNNRFKPGTREYYGPVDGGRSSAAEWAENYMYDANAVDAKGELVP